MRPNPSWDADSRSAIQEIPRFLWDPLIQFTFLTKARR
jgi:hypothetical protein